MSFRRKEKEEQIAKQEARAMEAKRKGEQQKKKRKDTIDRQRDIRELDRARGRKGGGKEGMTDWREGGSGGTKKLDLEKKKDKMEKWETKATRQKDQVDILKRQRLQLNWMYAMTVVMTVENICRNVCVYMHVYVYIYIHTNIYIYIYIYMYIYV